DGRTDIVVVDGHGVHVRRQPTPGLGDASAVVTDVSVDGLGARGADVADMDNDGRPDLVAHGRDGLRLLRQADDGYTDATATAGLASPIYVHAVALVDLDLDGDLYIVAGGDARDGGAARLEVW